MSFVKNPIILAIIMSAIVFLVLTYFSTEENDKGEGEKGGKNEKGKGKKNKKNKKGERLSRESIIVISVIAGLGTWYLSSYMFEENGKEKQNVQGKSPENGVNGVKKQTGGGKLSEDSTRSYNLIGSGLNIPRSELKLPQVLIDYQ